MLYKHEPILTIYIRFKVIRANLGLEQTIFTQLRTNYYKLYKVDRFQCGGLLDPIWVFVSLTLLTQRRRCIYIKRHL